MTSTGMKILVTGGSGFLGKHVLRRLMAEGHLVTGLARSHESSSIINELGADVLDGDIKNVDRFENLLGQFDVVVHCAAPVEFWGPWEKYETDIVAASASLAKACAEKKVKRFICISSESVLQGTESLIDIDESHPYPKEPNSYYGKSKMLAEKQLLEMSASMEIVILRPTFIWGPDCPALSTITKKVNSGEFVWIDHGQASFEAVHVENVAEAITLSITKGRDRQIYFITDGEPSTIRDFFETFLKATGVQIPSKSIPRFLAEPLAAAIECLWVTFRVKTPPPLTRFDLAFVSMPRSYKIDRIKNDLGYRPIVTRKLGFQKLGLIMPTF